MGHHELLVVWWHGLHAVSSTRIDWWERSIGCLGMRACHTNNCPVGIATQKDHLRARLQISASARRLANWFEATAELMTVLARAMGHHRLQDLCLDDLTTFHRDLAYLSGVPYGGVVPL